MARQSNIELLRLLLMLFVLMLHSIAALKNNGVDTMLYGDFIVAFVYCAVPVFILISGFFSIKLSFKKIANLYLQCAFYGLCAYISHLFFDGNSLGKSIFNETIFIFSHGWAFITNYFLLCLISPIINLATEYIPKFKFCSILLLMSIVNIYFGWFWGLEHNYNGYQLANYIYIYIR